jgi:hypothetical protein
METLNLDRLITGVLDGSVLLDTAVDELEQVVTSLRDRSFGGNGRDTFRLGNPDSDRGSILKNL